MPRREEPELFGVGLVKTLLEFGRAAIVTGCTDVNVKYKNYQQTRRNVKITKLLHKFIFVDAVVPLIIMYNA